MYSYTLILLHQAKTRTNVTKQLQQDYQSYKACISGIISLKYKSSNIGCPPQKYTIFSKKGIDRVISDIIAFMKIILTTLFGLESCAREDMEHIGYPKESMKVTDGSVELTVGDDDWEMDVARVNMWSARAERVLFEVGSFRAETFESFFDGCYDIPWNDYIPKGYAFIVNGSSRKSKIYGISACQSLAKKAIVRSLCTSRGLPEDGIISEDREAGEVRIVFSIVDNVVRMMIDTTGDGLHKRGYRPLTHEAPIRETLASGMVSLSRYRPFGYEALVDPFCGSGTILIEAARMAMNIAPGRDRHFSFEALPYIGSYALNKAREEALSLQKDAPSDRIWFHGSDIDPKAVSNARDNAARAGVADLIKFSTADAFTRTPEALKSITGFDRQLILTNPPYGGRLLTPEEADEIYRDIASCWLTKDGTCKMGIRLSVISPDDSFERAVGHKADKRTKLYNGNIKCQLNNYYRIKK